MPTNSSLNSKSNRHFLMLVAFLFFFSGKAQIANYVNNGGFETLLTSSVTSGFDAVKYWGPLDTNQTASFLFSEVSGTVPYCSTGFQFPRSGGNFILTQFFCNTCGRFYPRNRLKQNLQAGKTYCAKYYVVNTNNNRVAIDKFGMCFGDSSMDTITKCMGQLTYLNPQVENTTGIITDTLNWIPITGTFVATGNEKYMVIGNFRSNAATNTLQLNTPLSTQSADIYVDDVSVIDLNLPAYAGPDIYGIPTNMVYLGRPQDVGIDEACIWYKLPNTTTAIDTAAGITVTVASVTNTYMVKQDICGLIKYDTVIVYASGVGLVNSSAVDNSLKMYPNPATDGLNIECAILNNENIQFEIVNSLGQLVRVEEIVFKNNVVIINTKELKNGVYRLILSSPGTRVLNKDSSFGWNDNLQKYSKRFVIAR
ncbi:MAG: T9SS type A sorting domain-containing protein [Bacteroidetes bacterium]|nr:T9SS type A sorting domain-containing protein [Bacteroidota bacterium]